MCWAEGGGEEITDMRLLPRPSPPLLAGVQAPGAGDRGGLLTAWPGPGLGPRGSPASGQEDLTVRVCTHHCLLGVCGAINTGRDGCDGGWSAAL